MGFKDDAYYADIKILTICEVGRTTNTVKVFHGEEADPDGEWLAHEVEESMLRAYCDRKRKAPYDAKRIVVTLIYGDVTDAKLNQVVLVDQPVEQLPVAEAISGFFHSLSQSEE